ncbi:hypothetical protein H072_10060 [Dactylellina haptotyla CBS 200.50]|uniref:Uncharacterized protein n=1 Tax=Dactylellina haptotyla (strain CBS 200.50) TaxID=1284197 RepID=S8A151_DACHA|nr:hypothetical protein H072_10060 [Dactylellina haptotyla CBS 200.50]
MSSESSNDNSSSSTSNFPQRRGSITEYFRPPQPSTYPGPITTAAAQANHRRRMSYSGTGLTGTSPPAWFGGYTGARRGSMSSVSSTTSSPIDIESDDKLPAEPPTPTSGFARRLSFGARALRDVKRSMSFGTVGEGEPEHEYRASQQETMPPPPPPSAAVPKHHDEHQERMLKGDFYF